MNRTLKKLAFLALLLLPVSPAAAESKYDEAVWEALAKNPDVEMKNSKPGERVALFKSGVQINEVGYDKDNSGLGAVRCSWDMYVMIKSAREICGVDTPSPYLDYGMKKTREFILANNQTPITAADLDAEYAKILEKEKTQYDKVSDIRKQEMCTKSAPILIDKQMATFPLDQFKQAIDKQLSVPRPPVDKPSCF